MGLGILYNFEPSMLGVSHIWCTRCGKVHSIDTIKWYTSPDTGSIRDWNGAEMEESVHHPMCDCGQDGIIGNAIHDANQLRTKDELVMFPRHKDIMVWNKVEPYRTKKGHMSTWKPDTKAGEHLNKVYDNLQSKISTKIPLEDMLDLDVFKDLNDVFGNVNITIPFMKLATHNGLVAIYPRTPWHPKSPWDEKRRLGWRKDAKTDEWHNLEHWEDALEAEGFSMDRGRIPDSLVYDEAIGTPDDSNEEYTPRWIDPFADESCASLNGSLGKPKDWDLINDEVFRNNKAVRPEPKEEEPFEYSNVKPVITV